MRTALFLLCRELITIMKILTLLLSVLLLSSIVLATSTLEERLDAKMHLLIGQSIPSEYSLIADDGTYVVKFVDLSDIPDHVINFLDDVQYPNDLRYTVVIQNKNVTNVTKGGHTGYAALFGVTNSAATSILDSQAPLEEVRSQIQNSKIRFRAYGYTDTKLQFLKAVGGFLAGFSPDIAYAMGFLKGLI